MKALVVEDDFFSRTLLGEMLTGYGSVHYAANGAEALDAVNAAFRSRNQYQLICLDIKLPKMDGHQILRKVRELEMQYSLPVEFTPKIIMISALNDGENVLGAFREQCDGYLVKPFDENKLRELLTEFHLIDAKEPDSPRNN